MGKRDYKIKKRLEITEILSICKVSNNTGLAMNLLTLFYIATYFLAFELLL